MGDVREEIQKRFGPNVLSNLNKINMSLSEAKEWIRSELGAQQMAWFKAYSKAQQSITPNIIKATYAAFLTTSPGKEEWTYQTLSIRGSSDKLCQDIAKKAHNILPR